MALLILALSFLSLVRAGRVPAQGGPEIAHRNGDIDCDGQINISDPIALLNWLFSDGPEPCAIAQSDCCADLRQDMAALRDAVQSQSTGGPRASDLIARKGKLNFTNANERKTIIEVPDNMRFVVTSLNWQSQNGARLFGASEGNDTEAPKPPNLGSHSGDWFVWTSGFAFPRGADVQLGLDDFSNVQVADYYINGYLATE